MYATICCGGCNLKERSEELPKRALKYKKTSTCPQNILLKLHLERGGVATADDPTAPFC